MPIVAALAVAALIGLVLGDAATDLCRALATVATVIAALERRHAAMVAGVALATGLGVEGLALVPFAAGIAIQRRIGWHALAPAPLAFALGLLAPGGTAAGPIGLWAALAPLPDGGLSLAALVAAGAIGGAAWYGASLSARPVGGAALIDMASLATIGFGLLAPVGVTALVAPMTLAVLRSDGRSSALVAIAAATSAIGLPAASVAPLLGATALLFGATRLRAANDNPLRAALA